MAAQVEVQTGEVVGRTGVGGRLHLSPLTDSSNKSLTEGPSNIHGSLIITPEPSKPAPSPKPRLTPKPFAVEKNPTIRPILAPKPQPKPRPESTRHLSYKPDPPSILKPQQPNVGVTSKPRPVLTNPSRPAPTSFKPSPKLNTGQTTKPVAQPFKPAPPLPIGDSSKPTPPKPAERQKPIAVGVSFFRSPTKPPAAEWSGSTKKEAEKDNVGSGSRLGASTMTRAKSMGFLSQIGQAEEVMKEEEKKVTPTVALRPQSKGSRPRPVSAIFLPSPTQTESSAPPWVGRRPLSADLTSRFESIGLSLHRKPPNGDSKENTPEEGAPLRRREREKAPEMTLPIPQGSDGAAAKPAVSDSGNERGKEGTEKEKVEEKSGGSSIKRRISLLLDSSSPLMGVTGPGSEPRSPVQPISEAEVPLAGVKQRIRQLTVDIPPTQNPVVKPTPRPRPLALDLTKRFTPERSTDLGSPLLSEATDHHDSASDPQSRVEASAASSSDQTKMTDDNVRAQEQLTATSPSPVAGSSDEGRSISKERESGSEVQTVRASLFENVVERHSVQVLADDLPKDKGSALLRSLSVKQRDNEDDGTLVTATYREPVSPSSPMRVMHSFDTVPAVEGSRAVSESVPSAYLEDKAMTLRSRRSEGNRPPAVDRTPPVQGDTGLAPTPGQPPRYLRVGALPKWDASGPEQEVDMEKGRQRELEKERQLALERQREAERQRDAEREEAAAAPKRLKMLEADEQPKPRATYFALTGQIQEPASPVDVGNTPVLFDDVPARSGQWGSQGKIVPLRRNPSLDEAFGKTLQSPYQVEEPMERSQVSETERGSMRDKHMAGEAMEVEKQRDSRTETDSQREKKKELEREKQRQVDVERQKHLEFARMKERERQREFERQRQKEYEKEKQREERQLERERQLQLEKERQRDLERQTLLEMEKRRQQELERERQREQESERRLEKERLLQLEKERQCDLERQTLLEMEKRRQQELERERQREQESERQRQLEKERQLQLEKERQRDLERQKLLEMEERRQQELERERRREQESERQRQLEKERQKQVEIERERQKELERERQLEKERQRELERQREAERERRELDRQREIEKETQRELERQQELEKERRREMEKERQREMEKERQREMEKERQRELERQREVEKERQREMEKERQREMEKERQKELEKERKREVERQRELDKERRLLEMQRERQRSEELERIKEMERRQLQEFERQKKQMEMERRQQELEKQRLREKKEMEEADKLRQMALQLEAERLREAEQERVKELEKEQQRELERQRQRDLVRQKKLDFERREMENQNMRQLELEKERRRKEELDRIKEMERRQLLEFEKQKQAERMQLAEVEKQRLRERIEREEAEKMRQVAKQQDAERHRIKEKQRREEQERADPPPLRPKVLDLDSVLREDQRPKASSHHGDPATRWKQPSPRTDEPYKPVILDIDSFTSQTRHSPSKEVFPFAGIQDAGAGAKSLPLTPERGSKAAPEALAVRRTPSSQDPWELRPGEMSVDRPAAAPEPPRKPANKPSLDQLLLKHEERHQAPERRWPALADEPPHATACLRTDTSRAGSPGRAPYSNSTPMELVWAPKESEPKGRSGNARGQRRSQGSQELNRMRSRSVSRRSMPAESAVEGNLSRMRSRSAHRERDQQSWVQQKQSGSGEDEGKDTETLVHETDSQYGTWETGLHTDDSLTPATPSSDGNLSPSPRKSTPPQTPEDPAPSIDTDTPDGLSPLSPSEIEPLSFPEVPATLLDTSALRSRAQLGKKRAPRSRPSRAARQNTALTVLPEGQAGATEDWRYRDSTEEKVENKQEDSDSEEQARGADSRSAASSQPQRIALFPGMDPSALKAQLKKRGESDCQLDGPSPSQLSRSPKSPFLPRAARVLPPSGGKENGEEESPKWLRELKSKKRLSQYENDS